MFEQETLRARQEIRRELRGSRGPELWKEQSQEGEVTAPVATPQTHHIARSKEKRHKSEVEDGL